MLRKIYNSRNSKDLIVNKKCQFATNIYNSRNSKDLIVYKHIVFKIMASTTVEIQKT